MDVKAKIREFLSGFFSKREIGDEEDVFALGFVNSLFAMKLVAFLEEDFGIVLGNRDLNLDNFRTVRAIAELIEKKLSGLISIE